MFLSPSTNWDWEEIIWSLSSHIQRHANNNNSTSVRRLFDDQDIKNLFPPSLWRGLSPGMSRPDPGDPSRQNLCPAACCSSPATPFTPNLVSSTSLWSSLLFIASYFRLEEPNQVVLLSKFSLYHHNFIISRLAPLVSLTVVQSLHVNTIIMNNE